MAKSRNPITTVTAMPYPATVARLNRLPDSHVMPAACPPPPSSHEMPTAAPSSGKASEADCVSLYDFCFFLLNIWFGVYVSQITAIQ